MNAKNTRRLNVRLDESEAAYIEEYAERTYRTPQQVVQMFLSTAIRQAISDTGTVAPTSVAEVRPAGTDGSLKKKDATK